MTRQFSFLISEKEELELVNFCFQNNMNILPAKYFKTEKLEFIKSLEDFKKAKISSFIFYIFQENTKLQLENKKDGLIVDQNNSFVIEYISPAIFEDENLIRNGRFRISDKKFLNDEEDEKIILLRNYELIKKYLKSFTTKTTNSYNYISESYLQNHDFKKYKFFG